jgi:Tfp pilus assembly PilM family ATPase
MDRRSRHTATGYIRRIRTGRWQRFVGRLSGVGFGQQLGIVISPPRLNIAVIARQGLRLKTEEVKTFSLPAKFSQAPLSDCVIPIAQEVAAFTRHRGLQTLPMNISVCSDDFAFRRILLPDIPLREIKEALYWEAGKVFPFDISACNVSYRIFEPIDIRGKRMRRINLEAVPAALVDVLYDQWSVHGMRLADVRVAPVMYAETIASLIPETKSTNYVLLCFDPSYSLALFVLNGVPVFYQRFSSSTEELPEGGFSEATMIDLRLEFQSILDMYDAQEESIAPEIGFITSTGGNSVALCSAFADAFKISFSPLAGSAAAEKLRGSLPQEDFETHFDAILTASAVPNTSRVAPESYYRDRIIKSSVRRMAAAAILAAVILCGLYAMRSARIASSETMLRQLEAQSAQIEQSPAYVMYLNLRNKMAQYAALSSGQASPSHFHLVFKELSNTVADEIQLVSLWFNNADTRTEMNVSGDVTVTDFSPEIILAEYVERLNDSPLLTNVSIASHSKEIRGNKFTLHFVLQMGVVL